MTKKPTESEGGKRCSGCGILNPLDAVFCYQCGTPNLVPQPPVTVDEIRQYCKNKRKAMAAAKSSKNVLRRPDASLTIAVKDGQVDAYDDVTATSEGKTVDEIREYCERAAQKLAPYESWQPGTKDLTIAHYHGKSYAYREIIAFINRTLNEFFPVP